MPHIRRESFCLLPPCEGAHAVRPCRGRSGRPDGSTDVFQPRYSPGSFWTGPSPPAFAHRLANSESAAQRRPATRSLSSHRLHGGGLHELICMTHVQMLLRVKLNNN